MINSDKTFKLSSFVDGNNTEGFPSKYIPHIVETADGFFIEPVTSFKTGGIKTYVKFLILDKNFIPIHGHDYAFVKLPTEGYLMRILLNNKTDKELSEDFIINYVIDINNITVVSSREINTQSGVNELSTIEIKAFENIIDSYDERIFSLLSNKDVFFKTYLKDIV